MSVQSARDFLDKAKSSDEIQKHVQEGKKSLMDIGKDHGYDFSREDIGHAMKERNMTPPGGEDDPDTCMIM